MKLSMALTGLVGCAAALPHFPFFPQPSGPAPTGSAIGWLPPPSGTPSAVPYQPKRQFNGAAPSSTFPATPSGTPSPSGTPFPSGFPVPSGFPEPSGFPVPWGFPGSSGAPPQGGHEPSGFPGAGFPGAGEEVPTGTANFRRQFGNAAGFPGASGFPQPSGLPFPSGFPQPSGFPVPSGFPQPSSGAAASGFPGAGYPGAGGFGRFN